MRRRGELLERTFAHCLETGAMRRVHLRGRSNILKRYLIHVAAFNLGILMRSLIGKGTPRGLRGLAAAALSLYALAEYVVLALNSSWSIKRRVRSSIAMGLCHMAGNAGTRSFATRC